MYYVVPFLVCFWMFSVLSGNPQQVLKDHMHYVQGIAWDPIGQYFASISNDRTCRIYCNKPQNQKRKSEEQYVFTCQNVLVKAELVKQEEETCPKVKFSFTSYVLQKFISKQGTDIVLIRFQQPSIIFFMMRHYLPSLGGSHGLLMVLSFLCPLVYNPL